MQRVDYADFIKPLLRTCGLAMLSIFLITCAFSAFPFQFLKNPVESLKLMTEFLERSNLLAMALLLILLSLASYTNFTNEAVRRRQLGFRDKVLMKARILVGLAALFYLTIIPYTLIQAQTLENAAVRKMDELGRTVTNPLKQLKMEMGAKGEDPAALLALKQKYPWINSPEIKSIGDLRKRVDSGIKKAESTYVEQRSFGTKQLYGIVMRICILAAIHTALISYFWFYWPRVPKMIRLDLLGVESEDRVDPHADAEEHGNVNQFP